jgi:hypothetical protein
MNTKTAIIIIIAALCAGAWAADNAVIAPQTAVSQKPQATTYGAEAVTIPQMLSYQGRLTDTLGQPVPNGSYSVAFKLYTVPSGGSAFWNETQSVTTKAGLFNVLLGSVTPIGSIPAAGAVYLAMAVSGGAELTPRLRIVSAAYAYKADTANYALAAAGGGSVTSVAQATGIVCTPNPITATGTVQLDSTYGDVRYVNATGDSMSGRLVVAGSNGAAAVYGMSDTSGWAGRFENTSGSGGAGCFGNANHAVPGYIGTRGSSDAGVGLYGYNDNTTHYAVRAFNASGSTAPGLRVDGTSYFTGAKTGFVADLCRNASNRVLEPGDVVVVIGCEPAVLGSVPVPLVAAADKAGQTGVIGVVDSRQIVDPAGVEPDDGPTATRANPAGVRHAPGSIKPGDYLLVATLGAYRGVRVDASYGSVQPGDLLVASPHAGLAMPTDSPQPGAVVGKALSGLDAGTGLVPIIILQQ